MCGCWAVIGGDHDLLVFRCHCTDELKLSGVGFGLNILIPNEGLEVLSGTLKTWSKVSDNGTPITNHICGDCGTLLNRSTTRYPGTVVIKAGTVDGDAAKTFMPTMEIFTRSKLPWVPAVEGAKQCVGDIE